MVRGGVLIGFVMTAVLATNCGGSSTTTTTTQPATSSGATANPCAAAPDAGPPANPCATASNPCATPTPTPTPTPEPTPAPAAFTPTDADRTAWDNAEHVLDFNARANFGGGALTTGFTPDPWPFPLTAGGGRNPVDVATLNMRDSATGAPCGQSFVTRRPDFHFNFTAGTTFPLLRFYVITENAADATLVINEPGRGWRCNDDHHHEGWENPLMPVIDFHNPPAGRYDIWVGTYTGTRNNHARLFVTELDSNHP